MHVSLSCDNISVLTRIVSDLSSANLSWKGSSHTATIVMWLPAEFCLNHSESFWVNIWIIQNGFRQIQFSVCCYVLIWIIQHRFRSIQKRVSQVSEWLNSSEKIQTRFRTPEFFWIDSDWFQKDSAWFEKPMLWIQKDSDLKICTQTDSESIQKKSAWFSMNSEIFIHVGLLILYMLLCITHELIF